MRQSFALKIFLFLALFSFCEKNLPAIEDTGEVLNSASQAYYKGDFEVAKQIYLKILEEGFSSGDLYYNLGNISYREGYLGEALAYYEKAFSYKPRDADLKANYQFILKKRQEPQDDKTYLLWDKVFFIKKYLTVNENLIFFLVFWTVTWSFFIFGFFLKKTSLMKYKVLFLGISLYLGVGVFYHFYNQKLPWAYTLSSVSVSPNYLEKERVLLKLGEGSRVCVVSEENVEGKQWAQIRLPNGQMGWLEKNSLKLVGELL